MEFLVCGLYWFVQAIQGKPDPNLEEWNPTLTFSCGFDALTTAMIAGRLFYHHRKQRGTTESKHSFYLPILTIFIEPSALSQLRKYYNLTRYREYQV
jgi:hypothetical protein